jgi:hypothetical protein
VLYGGLAERDRLLLRFLRESVTGHEPCLYVLAQQRGCCVSSTLVGDRIGDRPLPAIDPDHRPFPLGLQVTNPVTEVLRGWSATVFDDSGCSAARAVVDMSGIHPESPHLYDAPGEHGRGVTAWATSRQQLALSLYNLEVIDAGAVYFLAKTHRKVWMGGLLIENPYATSAA